jgi:soluble lytic murein transglycosylase-like protein
MDETTDEPVEMYSYYDVPLDSELQNHIVSLCGQYSVDPDLVIAMIQKESNFDPDTIGDNGASFGLMQVQPYWHEPRMTELGCLDLLDPYQNVEVGIDILAELFEKSDYVPWVLMAYNGGESYATDMVNNGQISEYARLVLKYQSELRHLYYG